MVVKRTGLGKNLSVLLGKNLSDSVTSAGDYIQIAINHLEPGRYQPRVKIDEERLNELVLSIKKQGILQPLLVRPLDNERYEILAGERRWRASKLAGLTEVPILIRKVNDETAIALGLVENLQREDLNPIDQAQSFFRLTQEFALTHQQIAELLSTSRSTITNMLRLLSLTEEVQQLLSRGILSTGHARTLLPLAAEEQSMMARLIVDKNLSVRETEQLIRRLKEKKEKSLLIPLATPSVVMQNLKAMADYLSAKITLKKGKGERGSIVIHYDNFKSLQRVLDKIRRPV